MTLNHFFLCLGIRKFRVPILAQADVEFAWSSPPSPPMSQLMHVNWDFFCALLLACDQVKCVPCLSPTPWEWRSRRWIDSTSACSPRCGQKRSVAPHMTHLMNVGIKCTVNNEHCAEGQSASRVIKVVKWAFMSVKWGGFGISPKYREIGMIYSPETQSTLVFILYRLQFILILVWVLLWVCANSSLC